MNQYSALGVDPEFGKGNEEIDREIGDPKHKPNPCLGPVEKAPFYAIQLYPGDGSTTVGLKIDAHCRVLDAPGDPLPGLYAAGLDANFTWPRHPTGLRCNPCRSRGLATCAGQGRPRAPP